MSMIKWLRHEIEPQIKDKANDKRMTDIEDLYDWTYMFDYINLYKYISNI